MIEKIFTYSFNTAKLFEIILVALVVISAFMLAIEKQNFGCNLLLNLAIIIVSTILGIQNGSYYYDVLKMGDEKMSMAATLKIGKLLLMYCFLLTIILIIRVLLVKSDYVSVEKGKVNLLTSYLWGSVMGCFLIGCISFFIGLLTYFGSLKIKVLFINLLILAMFFIGPIYIIGHYPQWLEGIMNVGPIRGRIIAVQGEDK